MVEKIWLEYNDDMQKVKVLIVSYYYPPSGAVGAKRQFSVAKTMGQCGYDVDVMSANWEGEKVDDVLYFGNVINYFKKTSLNTSPGKAKIKPAKKRLIAFSDYIRSVDKTVISAFVFRSIRYLFRNRKRKYDVIIVSYKPTASILVGIVASVIYKCPLIVEMRDLISIFGRKKKRFLLHLIDRLLDKLLMRFADYIVVVSPTQKVYAERFYGREIDLIYNGIDENEFIYEGFSKTDDTTRIFYSGSLSSARRLDRISEFIENYKGQNKLELIIASQQNPIDFGASSEYTNWLGFIDRKDVYDWQKKSDFLLIIEGMDDDSIENIPAKLYEYLGTNRPILADCNPSSDIVKLITDTEHGCNIFSSDDFNAAIDKKWKLSLDDTLEFSRKNQNKKYINLVERAVGA